jgi:1-aminocyclopropane-1-carboxylate deaminase/D-cysteine desulfhydrase-like pyridoxal-dependent ACC family enzyme
VVTTGSVQSNHCRVTAAAAARLGLGCVLVVSGTPPEPPTGNALLQRRFGARIRPVADRAARDPAARAASAEVAEAGGRALQIPLGASTPVGALGYVRGLLEFHDQLAAVPDRATHVLVSSSSGGTLAGLWAGLALLERDDISLTAVSSDTPADELRAKARVLARGALGLLDADPESAASVDERVEVTDGQVGPGYGVPTPASDEAAELLARSEGIVVDPVYTAKAAAEVVEAVRSGRFPTGDRIVFWHTGGHPALFA